MLAYYYWEWEETMEDESMYTPWYGKEFVH
jgi:hypothetical protein